jgi:ATP-binding cassette, subfamily F, member 3
VHNQAISLLKLIKAIHIFKVNLRLMLISLNNVTFEFGARAIIKNSSWTIFPKERIGLIGANGMGKSTILKLLVGEFTPSAGTVERPKSTTIGYFHQDLQSLDTRENILEVASHAFDEAKRIQAELRKLETKLENGDSSEEELIKYSELLHDFELAGGYEMEYKTAEVLEGLGFNSTDLERPFAEFSGGWRMRVMLAKMILQKPDLLLLDEPTNHLDLPSITWIEGFLQNYAGAVVIVSHDRYFLDRMVTKIVEVSFQQLNIYSGNYSFYETEKEVRIEFQQREYENQQDYIRQQERFIERFKAKASKATQAQSAMKRLDKLDKVEAPNTSVAKIRINFNVQQQPGKVIVEMEDVSKSYGDLHILKNAKAEILRGEKIALIGANGKGKSTMLRIITDREPIVGKVNHGHNVTNSFYAQHQLEALNMQSEILDELKNSTQGFTEMELRALLGCFLFAGDDVFKKISILSGGEKARVALAKVITQRSNFLLLDEPTNHLDLNSVNMLADALNKYEGSYIIVSHDRYFIEKTATKIWEIEDGKINEFIGTYNEWEVWKAQKAAQEKASGQKPPVAAAPKLESTIVEPEKKADPALQTSAYKEAQKKIKQIQSRLSKVEADLSSAQTKKAEAEALLGDPAIYADREKFLQTEKQYELINNTVNQLKKEYETLFEELIGLES